MRGHYYQYGDAQPVDWTALTVVTAIIAVAVLIGVHLHTLVARHSMLTRLIGPRTPMFSPHGVAAGDTAWVESAWPAAGIPDNRDTATSLRRPLTAHITYGHGHVLTATVNADFFAADPYTIRLSCTQGLTRNGLLMLDVSRDLIREAMTTYTRVGEGHTKICVTVANRRTHIDIDYQGPLGHVAMIVPVEELRALLDSTDAMVAPGTETIEFDAELAALLDTDAR